MEKDIVIEAIKVLLKENYSWSNYNPRGEYVNVCFTFKGADMYQLINKILKEYKIVRLEV